jgi:DNA-binding response OmpR family regulator
MDVVATRVKRIAILDDEDKFRVALSRLLRAHGYDVIGFQRGEDLIEAIALQQIDCVLLDLFMPGMSGFDVLAAFQAQRGAPPVIVVSAHDESEMRDRALALNAMSVQRKPIAAALLAEIKRAVTPGAAA